MPGTSSITGLQSGLDTVSIVDKMIELERQNAVLLEYDKAVKTNIISAFKALEARFLALQTQISSLTRTSTFEQSKVTVSDSGFLTATTTGRTGTGSYDIQVLSLARNHQIASQGFSDESLSDLGTGTIEIGVGGATPKTITIDETNNSLIGIKTAINDADIGVTATIINDGSDLNSYRLILSADKTGRANTIEITSNLTDGLNLDYTASSFDLPETIKSASGSTSTIALGASASYTGTENKTFTFTVQGSGEMTLGGGAITINWTDGTNSGSIDINAADTEVELTGVGADGLYLTFGAGTLTAGDEFQVSTFTPLLQAASDAKLALGSSGGSGSPITVTSDMNTLKDVIAGVTIYARKETDPGDSVSIKTEIDVASIKANIKGFIDAFNGVVEFIDNQNTYSSDTGDSGILFGDVTVWSMQSSLRSVVSGTVAGVESKFNQLYTIGIRTKTDGTLGIYDNTKLEEALVGNLDDIINLFTGAGVSSNSLIEFAGSGSKTKVGTSFDVDITQAATVGTMTGSGLTDPATEAIVIDATSNKLKLTIDGLESNEILLGEGTYSSTAALVEELQDQIDADSNIGSRGILVEWIDNGDDTGYLKFSSGTYGSSSTITRDTSISDTAYSILGLASVESIDGLDVEGTINGEEAEGSGQFLTGKEDNDTTDGLRLQITMTAADLVDGVEGTITPTRGVASQISDTITSLTLPRDGTFARRVLSYEKQIETLEGRIEDIDERLAIRRETLLQQFYEMEMALSRMAAEQQFLTTQLAGINNNWTLGRYNK
jgi:flagellar hook-associated protein 2